ncbi:MAG: hypothetical protein J5693_03010 [Bacteroidales bacterium]|nr:hypothetical protein [Bacteroidales bacterium]
MQSSDLRREENYNEYLRLLQDDDYYDVTFDEESGGMSAVHLQHKFAKQQGVAGMRRSDYERAVLIVLRKKGHRIVLAQETNEPGVKSCDGYLDDIPMEIKAIEGHGTWAISSKLRYAEKQHAQCVVLYFPSLDLYSKERLADGIGKYLADPITDKGRCITQLLAISGNELLSVWNKKATPIEGWSILEGFRR